MNLEKYITDLISELFEEKKKVMEKELEIKRLKEEIKKLTN